MEDQTVRVIHDVICSLSEDFDRNRSFPDLLFFVLFGHKEVASSGTGLTYKYVFTTTRKIINYCLEYSVAPI